MRPCQTGGWHARGALKTSAVAFDKSTGPPRGYSAARSEDGSSHCAASSLSLGSRTEHRHSRPAHEPFSAIVWLLNLGKYAGVEGSISRRIQSTSSSNTLLLLLLWVSIGSLFYGARVGGDGLRIPIPYTMIWNSLSLIHFYWEGFLWVFRNPCVRGSRGPYRSCHLIGR